MPVENKALETLKVGIRLAGSTLALTRDGTQAEPNTLTPAVVRTAAKQTAEEAIEIQRKEMTQFGLVGDWSKDGTYRTMGVCGSESRLRLIYIPRPDVRVQTAENISFNGSKRDRLSPVSTCVLVPILPNRLG